MDGGGFAFPLFFIFLGLKLSGAVDWSWWWVTAPLWIDTVVTLLLGAVMFAFGLTAFGIFKHFRR